MSTKKKATLEDFLGATGKFPEGQISPHDQGEIQIGIYRSQGKVIVNFGKEVKWFGLNAGQAIDLGKLLMKHGKKILKGG